MSNKYYCKITDKHYTESQIKTNLSKAYKKLYAGEPSPICYGCGKVMAQGTAHILPRSICKQLHLTSLIWNPINMFPACYLCNQTCENVSSDEIKELLNYEQIEDVIRTYDPVRYFKLTLR